MSTSQTLNYRLWFLTREELGDEHSLKILHSRQSPSVSALPLGEARERRTGPAPELDVVSGRAASIRVWVRETEIPAWGVLGRNARTVWRCTARPPRLGGADSCGDAHPNLIQGLGFTV